MRQCLKSRQNYTAHSDIYNALYRAEYRLMLHITVYYKWNHIKGICRAARLISLNHFLDTAQWTKPEYFPFLKKKKGGRYSKNDLISTECFFIAVRCKFEFQRWCTMTILNGGRLISIPMPENPRGFSPQPELLRSKSTFEEGCCAVRAHDVFE